MPSKGIPQKLPTEGVSNGAPQVTGLGVAQHSLPERACPSCQDITHRQTWSQVLGRGWREALSSGGDAPAGSRLSLCGSSCPCAADPGRGSMLSQGSTFRVLARGGL